MSYAEGTKVSTEVTRAEIERLLIKYGCDQFFSGWSGGAAYVAFRAKDRMVRFNLPLPKQDEERFLKYHHGAGKMLPRKADDARKQWEQACRERWRSLLLNIKAKMDAVDTGIESFEQAFLAQIVLPDGKLMGDYAVAAIAKAYATGKLPQLLPHVGDE